MQLKLRLKKVGHCVYTWKITTTNSYRTFLMYQALCCLYIAFLLTTVLWHRCCILAPFYRWWNWGTERWTDLFRVIQLVRAPVAQPWGNGREIIHVDCSAGIFLQGAQFTLHSMCTCCPTLCFFTHYSVLYWLQLPVLDAQIRPTEPLRDEGYKIAWH